MKKVKIAQIGTSRYSHGGDIIKTLKRNDDLFEIVGYALPENERTKFEREMPLFDGLKEMTVQEILSNPDIEAVTVETEEMHLTKYAQMAADAQKHIHMEKPGGTDLKSFEKMIETVKKSGKVFHTGYMYRYNPYIKDLYHQIENGELGDIITVEAQMNCLHPIVVRNWLNNYKGGMMFFLGCHLIDIIYRIQGMPDRVLPMHKSSGIGENPGEDVAFTLFEYKNGVSFAKTTAIEHGGFKRRQLVVSGTKKTVEIKPLEFYPKESTVPNTIFCEKNEYMSGEWADNGTHYTSDLFNRYDEMMRSFAAMVRGEKTNPYTPDYELELYRLVLKACGM